MEPDKLQQAWQAHSSQTRVTVNADALLKAVQANEIGLRFSNVFGDCIEIGSSLLFIPLWVYLGIKIPGPLTWYLLIPVFVWSILLTLIIRARQRRKPREVGEPLQKSVKESLALVEHEIWWSRQQFLWVQLPTAVGMLIFFASVIFSFSHWPAATGRLDALGNVLIAVICFGFMAAVVFMVYGSTYFLNRRIVRTLHEPRRRELLALLASLTENTATGEVSGEYPALMGNTRCKTSPRKLVLSLFVGVALMILSMAALTFLFGFLSSSIQSERSPFAAVRWQELEPEVEVGEEWFKLVSIDGVPAADIVAFSKKTYGDRWRKRFEEDLIALMAAKGHPLPGGTVNLEVQSLTTQEVRTLKDVPMTQANRQAIWDAAEAREQAEKK